MLGAKSKNNHGFALIAVLIASAVILIIVSVVYFRSAEDTKNVIETKQQAEEQIEVIEKQIDKINQRIEEQESEAAE